MSFHFAGSLGLVDTGKIDGLSAAHNGKFGRAILKTADSHKAGEVEETNIVANADRQKMRGESLGFGVHLSGSKWVVDGIDNVTKLPRGEIY